MDKMTAKNLILEGKTVLGIELGSTRIKGVLLDNNHEMLAQGGFSWENRLENGIWTYHMDEVWSGLQACFADLKANVKKEYDVELTNIGAIGISAMMHGYLVFNENNELLAPFRTWRNTMTDEAVKILVKEFDYQIPQRWSIAHLYQSILDDHDYIKDIRYMSTLAGYVHWMLTGEKVLGADDASGMFPIDIDTKDFDAGMLEKFDALVADKGYPWKLKEILPKVLLAGESAGTLTEKGAKLLDRTGGWK